MTEPEQTEGPEDAKERPEEEEQVESGESGDSTEKEQETEEVGDKDLPPHPIELLATLIGDIDAQIKRCQHKNITNLKAELLRNIYPILRGAFGVIHDWMMDIEERDAEAAAAEIQDAVEEEMEELLDICGKIVSLEKPVHDSLMGDDVSTWDEISNWARKKIEENPVEPEEPESTEAPEGERDAD